MLLFKVLVFKEACLLIPLCCKTEVASYCDFAFISRKHSKIRSIRSLTAQPSEQHAEVPKQVSDVDESPHHTF